MSDLSAPKSLGRFVRELGADYRRTTGSTLVLSRLELGSTLLEFVDQVVAVIAAPLVIIEAAERMGQFYKYLKEQLKGPEVTQAALTPPMDASPARLLEIAANSGANLKISRGKGKTKEVIELTHTEVSMRNANAKARKKNKSKATAALSKPAAPFQIGHLSERLRTQVAAAPEQVESLVELFVDFLKSNGGEYQLPALAQDLESHSLYHIAAVVRRHIKPGPTQRVTT
ncbi:hypothetical protein EDC40_107269 [Aminobacter aminovorans]|uniref:Uncharacterized protein n=1 Tax=Aminobacter aminovorans TaxID=83263 RepID=A0A381IJZ7_AMIAI|nr:hypothetical protein [Aminobacter aminovorans]TCS25069.1 hypothetical protein EDC40_107269 [Aminobacter aminovorans]SUY28433.1 Uncharacterised protein [Aminobacter aminovorans]